MNNNNNKFSLRPLTDNDADSLARQLNNKKVWDNLRDALPYPYTSQDAAWFINFQQNDPLLTCYGIVVMVRLLVISDLHVVRILNGLRQRLDIISVKIIGGKVLCLLP